MRAAAHLKKNHRQIFHGPHPFRDWPIAHNRTIESPEGSILIRERNHGKTSFVSELDITQYSCTDNAGRNHCLG